MCRRIVWGCVGLLSTAFPVSAVGPIPFGGQFQVNSYSLGNQYRTAVAMDARGRFVVTWTSQGSSGTDSSYHSIQGQRLRGGGDRVGAEFQVNTFTTGTQLNSAAAMSGGGDFVVVWDSLGSSGSDISHRSIQGQRYDGAGNPLGGQFQVNSLTTLDQHYPAVAMDADGDFVVVWDSAVSGGSDTQPWSVQGQRYDAAGTPVGGEFQVNTYTSDAQTFAAVAMDPNGNFVVVWWSWGSSGTDTDTWSVQGQRYDAAGDPVGGEFQVNTYTTSFQRGGAVALDAAGNFVVVWQSRGSSGSDVSGSSIQGQRYDAAGDPVGGEFQVNTYTTGYQVYPAVAMDTDGSFVVVWQSEGSGGSDGSENSIQGQRYDAAGAPVGSEFQVNTYTTADQRSPGVAAIDAEDDIVVVWESVGSSGPDTSFASIQGQRYRDPVIFLDGFESGDTSAWSGAVP